MKSVLLAKNVSELLYQLNINQGLQIVGGCTRIDELPERTVSTYCIKELSQIVRHERFIEVGPGATLSKILDIGSKHLPQVLYEALKSIANPMIRNMATIGGNICSEGQKLTLFAPLMVLDTKLEFKNQSETRLDSIVSFKKIPEKFVLTKIRIPLPDCNVSIFRRIGPEHTITEQSASFAFIATTEKNILLDVHLAFAGPFAFRSRNFENTLIGHRLPLTQKDVNEILESVEKEFNIAATDQMISDVTKQQFLNITRFSFEQLT